MFERFTDRARKAVQLAEEEARLLKHNYIGTEHLLLGLLHMGEGAAAEGLTRQMVTLEGVRQQTEEIIGRGDKSPGGHIPFTPRAKKVLEMSVREAERLESDLVHAAHLLLGLVLEGEGVACQIMVKLGTSPTAVQRIVAQLMHERGDDGESQEEMVRAALETVGRDELKAHDGEPLVTVKMREGDVVTTFELLSRVDALYHAQNATQRKERLADLLAKCEDAASSRRRDEKVSDEGSYWYRIPRVFDR